MTRATRLVLAVSAALAFAAAVQVTPCANTPLVADGALP